MQLVLNVISFILIGLSYLVYQFVVVRQLNKHDIKASDDFESFRFYSDVRRYMKECSGSIWVCIVFGIAHIVVFVAMIRALLTQLSIL